MTCSDILTMAVNLLAEEKGGAATLSEFSERAPFILAAFCGEARIIDKRYREAFMLDEQPAFDKTRLTADSAFPLCDRLAGAAACYLASTLIVDENPSISDIFGERCRDALESAYGEIPFDRHSIVNVYP